MTYFLKAGNTYSVTANNSIDLHKALPVGTYTVKWNDMTGSYYLEQIADFEHKGKLYGDTLTNVDRILNTFKSRDASTGVMLTGEKGSGKTLLAKMLSVTARTEDIPTIVINQPWAGDVFNTFMQTIEQPTVVIFDEFEKVYDSDTQEKMLTLLDGVYQSKKLFIITCNDKYRVNTHMRNRPGRIFYRLDYRGLTNEFILEYCADNLDNKAHTDAVCRMAVVFSEFNFDMLKAMIEEMNRYNETPQQVMRVLNAKPEFDEGTKYAIKLFKDGEAIPEDRLYRSEWSGNPLVQNLTVEYRGAVSKPLSEADKLAESMGIALVDEDDQWQQPVFTPADLHAVNPETGTFTFINKTGLRLELSRVPRANFNWDAY